MKLNGWQRIGVVASVLSGIAGAIYERNKQIGFANDFLNSSINRCLPSDADACVELAYKTHSNLLALDGAGISNILFVALGPIIAGWLLAYMLLKVFRWVKAGF